MQSIKFNFAYFCDWYYNNRNNKKLFKVDKSIRVFWYQKDDDGYFLKPNSIHRNYKVISEKFSSYAPLGIYMTPLNNRQILFIVPRVDENDRGTIWADHFHFVGSSTENNKFTIKFHKTIEKHISPSGKKTYKSCFFDDDVLVPYEDKKYSIDMIQCNVNSIDKIYMKNVFEEEVEREVIKLLMIMPYLYPNTSSNLDNSTINHVGGTDKHSLFVIVVNYKQNFYYLCNLTKKSSLYSFGFMDNCSNHKQSIKQFASKLNSKYFNIIK
jgi:hypothetical protein